MMLLSFWTDDVNVGVLESGAALLGQEEFSLKIKERKAFSEVVGRRFAIQIGGAERVGWVAGVV